MKIKALVSLLVILAIIAFLVLGAFFYRLQFEKVPTPKPSAQEPTPTQAIPPAVFNCADGKIIVAQFEEEKVKLSLSDGRSLLLAQTISGSGARYANKDESVVFWNKGDTAFIEENGKTTFTDCQIAPAGSAETQTQIPNPASKNCLEKGGQLTIAKIANGSEYGLCAFEGALACEEWALFRGDCPVGGVKLTGFDSEEQKYCALLGGKTEAKLNAYCSLPDGKKCLNQDLFSGKCQ